ncbi:putative molybdenum transport ATP-binding protein ModF [compost metagenome]
MYLALKCRHQYLHQLATFRRSPASCQFGDYLIGGGQCHPFQQHIGFVSHDLQEDYTPYTSALDVVISGFFGSIGTHERLQPTNEQVAKARALIQILGVGVD